MHFNVAKCKCMLLTRKSNPNCPTLTLNGENLDLVTQYKYLGVIISSNLHWAPHIKQICSNAKKLLSLIYRNIAANNIQSSFTVLSLYLSLVRPCLEYVSQVWDPHLLKEIKPIQNVQKFALRVCYGQSYGNLLDIIITRSHLLEIKGSTSHYVHSLVLLTSICNFLIYPLAHSWHKAPVITNPKCSKSLLLTLIV